MLVCKRPFTKAEETVTKMQEDNKKSSLFFFLKGK